jgi:hypothetical protein
LLPSSYIALALSFERVRFTILVFPENDRDTILVLERFVGLVKIIPPRLAIISILPPPNAVKFPMASIGPFVSELTDHFTEFEISCVVPSARIAIAE